MRAQTIEINKSTGRLLHTTIIGTDGKKLLAKGHRITAEDAAMLARYRLSCHESACLGHGGLLSQTSS